MDRKERDILITLKSEPFINQRILSESSGYSLGTVNQTIKILLKKGYLNAEIQLTKKAEHELIVNRPQKAIILAAGCGMRMVPINMETSKGLLKVNKEVLIERIIKQLQEVGITEIVIVVGFMKEQYEYLIDDFHVELVVNPEYSTKNNLHSLKKVFDFFEKEKRELSNTYIIPCDIWCEKNPFNHYELYSWYMVGREKEESSKVKVNRKKELAFISSSTDGNRMIGIAYFLKDELAILEKRIKELAKKTRYNDSFWEEALYKKGKIFVLAKIISSSKIIEINTYEQLKELNGDSVDLQLNTMKTISHILKIKNESIKNIQVLKKGMTNHSLLFTVNNKRYIMRIPREGTEQLIDREKEAETYKKISGLKIAEELVYINPNDGYKITEYFESSHVCNPLDIIDVTKCMVKLKKIHQLELKVDHEIDIFALIDFYEKLWEGKASIYKDYIETKKRVIALRAYIEKYSNKKVLIHFDAVPDNFLIHNEEVRLIDWEYAGMQDPHIDIAMFSIYAGYNKKQIDQLINIYFKNQCQEEIRIKIYCYISVCGLLWSNWCEYKRNSGIEFGEYNLKQYRYAKEYYRIVETILSTKGFEKMN